MTVPTFVFDPHIQKLINDGLYELVRNKATGEALGIVRDKATGKFVGVAKAIINKGINVNPLFTPLNIGTNLVTSTAQMYQNHRGFQQTYSMIRELKQSIGVLQGTISLIGLGTVATVALSAVNLQQTLKLKADVKQLRLEVKDGFIDLKQALQSENQEILKRIEQVAQDVEYRQHRTILIQAYGRFLQAIECLRDGLKISDINLRNTVIGNAQKMLYDALADYKNPLLYDNSNTPGQLRRKECSWVIEQTLIMSYELQCAYETAIDRLISLQNNIREYLIELIGNCDDENELDFLFPEVTRINNHDLLVLENWQHNLDYLASLSSEEKKMFTSSELPQVEFTPLLEAQIVIEEIEEEDYRDLKAISHFAALKDNLKFTIQPQLRKECENYIIEQCRKTDRLSLAPTNLSELPNITIANLYWYLFRHYSISTRN